MNLILVSVFCSWLVSQLIKISITKKPEKFFTTGGMPSAHSAFVGSLSSAVGLLEGFHSSAFFITIAFSLVIVHDAIQIRRHHTLREVCAGIAIGIILTFFIYKFLF